MLLSSLPVARVLALSIVVLLAYSMLLVVKPLANVNLLRHCGCTFLSVSWRSRSSGSVSVGSIWALPKAVDKLAFVDVAVGIGGLAFARILDRSVLLFTTFSYKNVFH